MCQGTPSSSFVLVQIYSCSVYNLVLRLYCVVVDDVLMSAAAMTCLRVSREHEREHKYLCNNISYHNA